MKTGICILSVTCIALLLGFSSTGPSIKGKVTTDTGEPVIAAYVSLHKNGILLAGTITDIDGFYAFSQIDTGTYDIEVSYTGFVPQKIEQIRVAQNSVVTKNIVLTPGVVLDEVVVIGYGVSKKRDIAGAVSRAAPKKSQRALRGRVAGVQISASQGGNAKDHQSTDDASEFSRENYGLIKDNAFLAVTHNPLSTFSIDVDRASYSNVRRFLESGKMPPPDAVRIEEMINYFDYDYPEPAEHPFSIVTEMHACPWNKQHQLLHIGLHGRNIKTENIPASNLVFLLDVSGSMNAPNKLPLVISSFKLLTEALRSVDRIAIVVYAGSSGLVLPSTPGSEKQRIINVLDRLRAGGSTAGAAGIKLAYQTARENFIENGNNRVILATDGDFNVGVSSDAELVRIIEKERESGIFLTVLGFGMGNYQDQKMQLLADHGNGNHAYIDKLAEAKKVLINEFSGTLFTIARDVKIQVEFNPDHVQAYRLIGYENRLLADEDFNDDKKDAGEIGAGHTVTALYEIVPAEIETTAARTVDPLRYQKTKPKSAASVSDEWLHIKFRYKLPDGEKSILLQQAVTEEDTDYSMVSENFQWSAAVAAFGMLLRNSEHKGSSSMELVEQLASGAIGADPYGYRREFVELVGRTSLLASKE